MRYAEIAALPGPPEEAKTTIVNMVTMASSKNEADIPMEEVLAVLQKEGYDLSPRMVMDILNSNKLVKNVSKDAIYLHNENGDTGMISDQDKEKSKKHVEKLAKQTIKKDSRKS